jgi:hypothetical protein
MVPSVDEHLLQDSNAAYCRNAWLYSGALNGMPRKVPVYTLTDPDTTVAFRIPANNTDPAYLYDSQWMEFENPNTDFISAPVTADSFQRFYWTSTSMAAPLYNTYDRIVANLPAWKLGIPQPANISVVASGGTSATQVSRAYITTLVSEYGEEGPASNPFLINGKQDDTFAVTIAAVPADYRGVSRNVKKIRLYRTITSAAGTATYYLVTEVNATGAAQVYNDAMSDATLASNTILESTAWTEPPALQGFITMPNGIVAGYKGNELWFSEAYRPHAWPAAYSLVLEHDVVGMGIINQTLVVCTKGNPYTASGVNPASITTSKLAAFEPCLSKGSIVSTEEGVYYTSPNGLILVNPGIAQNITKQYISRDKWNEILNDGRVNAGRLGSAYYAFGANVQRVFQTNAFQNDFVQVNVTGAGAANGFMIDPTNNNVGFGFMTDTKDIKSVRNDQLSGELLAVRDGKVVWLDQRAGYGIDPYVWRSKVFQAPSLQNFAAFKCYFYPIEGFTFPVAQKFNLTQTFNPAQQLGIVRIYADDKLVLAHEIREPGELHRIPSGFRASFWYIEFEAQVKIKSFQMATTVKELSVV